MQLDLEYVRRRLSEYPFPSDQTKTEWILRLVNELEAARSTLRMREWGPLPAFQSEDDKHE